jgi:hypothetical protein
MSSPDQGDRSAVPGAVDLLLVFVRSILEDARATANVGDEIGAMKAIMLADNAVETLTKAACRELGVKEPNSDKLDDWLFALGQSCKRLETAPEVAAVKRLRKTRNSVHDANAVAPTSLERWLRHAEDFANLVVQEVFNRTFAEISVVGLVRDQFLRETLEKARELQRAGDLGHALAWACGAYEVLYIQWMLAVGEADGFNSEADRFAARKFTNLLQHLSEKVDRRFEIGFSEDREDAYGTAARMMLGFNVAELIRLRELCEVSLRVLCAGAREGPPAVESAWVDWVINVVARQAWRLHMAHVL